MGIVFSKHNRPDGRQGNKWCPIKGDRYISKKSLLALEKSGYRVKHINYSKNVGYHGRQTI